MEMKRTIMAVVLSMAVLLVFQKYLAPKPAPPQVEQPVAVKEALVPAEAQMEEVRQALPAVASGSGRGVVEELPISRTVLQNDVLKVELSNRAAAVVGGRLTQYREGPGADAPAVAQVAAASGLDVLGATRLSQSAPEWGRVFEEVEKDSDHVVYASSAESGVRIEKTFRLEAGHYDVGLEVKVINGSTRSLRDRLGAVMVQDFRGLEDRYTFAGPAYFEGKDYEEVTLKDVEKEGARASGTIWWAAFLEKYFLVAMVPETVEGNDLQVGLHLGTPKVVEMSLDGPAFELPPGGEAVFRYRLYVGPKKASVLAPLGSNLEHLIDYGFFNAIAQPLLWFLNWLYGYVGNYGIAIIILTTLIKLVFWPLSAKSYKSMQRMKELQPKMQRLKERYADDRERLNMEVMQLYKTHKVNPLGGCLPMLVQIPFFFALYRILLGSIELRHAPFVFWLQDLSAKDPYYITPVLMGVSMFLQQRMTPVTGGNETQVKMMMYGMPLVFTFMFLNFPSGLVVYWLVNNILSIAQQGWQLRQGKNKPAAA